MNTLVVVQNDSEGLVNAPLLHNVMRFNESSMDHLQHTKIKLALASTLKLKRTLIAYSIPALHDDILFPKQLKAPGAF